MTRINLLVAAGGTGGHLFPAMAVVEEFKQNEDLLFNAVFVGNKGRIEGTAVPKAGYDFYDIPMSGLRSKFSPKNILIPFKTLKSITICKKLIHEYEIDAVLCTGAYLSYPAGISASILKKPLILMESNVFPGKTIKALASRSNLILTSYEETFNYLRQGRQTIIRNIGNPVRRDLLNLPSKEKSKEVLGLNPQRKTLLVVGGSLGAESINRSVDKFISSGKAENYQIIWQTGKNYMPTNKATDSVKILQFIDDMSSVYAASDLVLARSGATTVAELCVTSKPAILVPYPRAANNHQYYNAELLEKRGAALRIKDNQLWEKIEYILPELMENSEKLESMAAASLQLAKPHATRNAADEIMRLLNDNNK